ncbi:hypothetical protein Ddye_004683 [Dipteronia dyeriana]|uniref:DUF4283 domain-containing protein n=1 Tax=Dipteronia dyeriana TaxID=168575 RepID=A0AAE0CNW8_9ROSI|nr:hypothetical protein Ddye_004683 [Dipteronia dyeriana]
MKCCVFSSPKGREKRGSASLGNWSGFGAGKEKLKIVEGDISFVEGRDGRSMKLSLDLKVIARQYLVVQKWRPNFVPGEDEIRQMLVRVRLSKLPTEWIDVDLLWNIEGMLGNAYKVYPITESQARWRFARICINLDITKPLKGSIIVDDRITKVEYENLGLIYFKGESNVAGNNSYGPWMQVSYGRNRRTNVGTRNFGRRNKSVGNSEGVRSGSKSNNKPPVNGVVEVDKLVVAKKGTCESVLDSIGKKCVRPNNPVNHGSKKVRGSRFKILSEDMEENFSSGKDQSRILMQKKPTSNKVLTEISNKDRSSKLQWSSLSKKNWR